MRAKIQCSSASSKSDPSSSLDSCAGLGVPPRLLQTEQGEPPLAHGVPSPPSVKAV
ncbi:hypothetical protein OY671_011854, partial [Metschnikowia pulcherrima]